MIHALVVAAKNIRNVAEESSGEELLMKQKIKNLNREKLVEILCKVVDILPKEQYSEVEKMVAEATTDNSIAEKDPMMVRMSQELVDEKLKQIKNWMRQIEEEELYLDTESYEDYSSGYWDADWITEYYDNQGIGDKLMSAIRFAKDCVDDKKYKEAHFIYEWLWAMVVGTDSEFEENLDLETLAENKIISADMKQLALLTLYTDYQVQKPENRAEDLFLYFGLYTFQKLHIEEMFHAGREQLTETEQFWKAWIALLKTKRGDVADRLLQEAVLYCEGIHGLIKIADENANEHPMLYLAAMKEYDKNHEYAKIEAIGQKAMEKLDSNMVIRSKIALKAAFAADYQGHTDEMMSFCWEGVRSDSTDRNFLRLFGMKEMAEKYSLKGKEILHNCKKGTAESYTRDTGLQQNFLGDYSYLKMCFYVGDFIKIKEASKNPKGSLGWSGSFIPYGIRMILLYLYDSPLPSKAAAEIAAYIGFRDTDNSESMMSFERDILEESCKYKTSIFWNYFQRWKSYFPMAQQEREEYLAWAEKIVYSRADAIVGGQHRNHYSASAQLLAIVGEIKESMGKSGAKEKILVEYKKKFPRHSSFQRELKIYFKAF